MKKQGNTLLFFGEALKAFGANGELIIKLSADAPAKINKKEPVFITIDGLSVPFYFKSAATKGNQKIIAVFDDMETEMAAMELIGKKIYYTSTRKKKATPTGLEDFIGFTLIDSKFGEIGEISDFFDFPGNPCFQVFYQEKEVLIPVNEDLIEGIDKDEQVIVINLPNGLIDIYLAES